MKTRTRIKAAALSLLLVLALQPLDVTAQGGAISNVKEVYQNALGCWYQRR